MPGVQRSPVPSADRVARGNPARSMIQKIRTGEQILQLWKRALRFALKRTGDHAIAEELASEAVCKLLAHPPEELLDEWTFVCREVLQLSERSRERNRRSRALTDEDADLHAYDPRATLGGLWVEEFLRIVREEAECLPEHDRRVVLAHLFEEHTFLEKAGERHARLAATLGRSVERTRQQLSRGLARLRTRLERRLRRSGSEGSFLILVPLTPQLLSRRALTPAWRTRSLLHSGLVPAAVGTCVLLLTAGSVALAARARVHVAGGLQADPRVASVQAREDAALPAPWSALVGDDSPSAIPAMRLTSATKRPRRPFEGFREDFDGMPVQVLAPRCAEGTVVVLGDSSWSVQNLRTESCAPSDNVNLVAIQSDGLRVAADVNDAHGGYVGVQHEPQVRPLEWRLTVRVTVVHVEDPYHRPVPQCLTSFGPSARFDDESLGWCTTRDGTRVQVLALKSPGAVTSSSYVVEPGFEHTIELTSLRTHSELRAWPSIAGERPAEPLARAHSLGELQRILFTGPNWKTFDYRVRQVSLLLLGSASYGTAVSDSTDAAATLEVWRDGEAPSDANTIDLAVRGLPPRALGRFVVGNAAADSHSGWAALLVGGTRHALPLLQADAEGRVALHLDEQQTDSLRRLGDELFLQFVYTAAAPGGARNATQGVRLVW